MSAVVATAVVPVVLSVSLSLMAFSAEFKTQQEYDDFFQMRNELVAAEQAAQEERKWDVWDGDKCLYPNLTWRDAWDKVRDIRDNWKDTDYIDDLQVKLHDGKGVDLSKDESMNWLKRWRAADDFANYLRRQGLEEDEVQRIKRKKYRDLYNEDGTPRTHNDWWRDKHKEESENGQVRDSE